MVSMNTLVKKKAWKKIYRKNGTWRSGEIADFWQNLNFAAIFGHFYIIKCDRTKNVSRYGLYKSIDEENRAKQNYRKNGKWTHNALSTEFFGFSIGYNSKTTPPRVKILQPVDFLGSNYPNKKFSSWNSKFSVFDTLAFFLPISNIMNFIRQVNLQVWISWAKHIWNIRVFIFKAMNQSLKSIFCNRK